MKEKDKIETIDNIVINGRELSSFKDDGDFEIKYGVDVKILKDLVKNQVLLIYMLKTDLRNIVEIWENCIHCCNPMNNCSSYCKNDCNCEFGYPLSTMYKIMEKYKGLCDLKIDNCNEDK